jgi:hypothetical protein
MPKFKSNLPPVYYKSIEEMDKPLSVLMEELRSEVGRTRGKLQDMRSAFGWEDRISHLEGGLTCMLVAMHDIMEEFQKFEKKQATRERIPWLKSNNTTNEE